MQTRDRFLFGASLFAGGYAVPLLAVLYRGTSTLAGLAAGPVRTGTLGTPVVVTLVPALLVGALALAGPGLGVSLYLDARSRDGTWSPNPLLYGVLGSAYPASLFVAAVYLYRRNRHVPWGPSVADARDARWWVLVAVGPLLLGVGLGAVLWPGRLTGSLLDDVYVRVLAMGLIGGAGIVAYYAGVAADRRLLERTGADWVPRTGRYVVVPTFLPVVMPLVAAAYLRNRRRHLGRP